MFAHMKWQAGLQGRMEVLINDICIARHVRSTHGQARHTVRPCENPITIQAMWFVPGGGRVKAREWCGENENGEGAGGSRAGILVKWEGHELSNMEEGKGDDKKWWLCLSLFCFLCILFWIENTEATFSGSLLRLLRRCVCIYICVCGSHVSGRPCKKLMGCPEKMSEINVRLVRRPGTPSVAPRETPHMQHQQRCHCCTGAGCLCVLVREEKAFGGPGWACVWIFIFCKRMQELCHLHYDACWCAIMNESQNIVCVV